MTQAKPPSRPVQSDADQQPSAFAPRPAPGGPVRRRAAFAFIDGVLVARDPKAPAEPLR